MYPSLTKEKYHVSCRNFVEYLMVQLGKVKFGYYNSPIGLIEVQAEEDMITSLMFCEGLEKTDSDETDCIADCIQQLKEYFEGTRTGFDIPVCQKGTMFQQRVWETLLNTNSYADIAGFMGNQNASRAIGSANGKNRIWIVVSCHRVIGSNGYLTGYAGGVARKRWLLDHESRVSRGSETLTQQKLFS